MPAGADGTTLRVPSRLDALAGLRGQVEQYALDHGLGPEAAADVVLCVHEAVSNAIVHGHSEDSSKSVEVTIEPLREGLRVTVRNDGPGFDVEDTFRRLDDARDQPRGRGIAIIRQLTDDAVWHDQGRELTFVKHR
ncbi:MAG: ATP-binding protein [Fimbriimonadaceae bacterium]|nr:ATP-binding protein [Fimbriimonadaceae bacterium]